MEEHDVEMEELAPDRSDPVGSDSELDARPGSKRKAKKQSTKVCISATHRDLL